MKLPRNLFLVFPLLVLDFSYGLENTNIFTYDREEHGRDYNRLRLETTLEHRTYQNLFVKAIIDNVSRYRSNEDHLSNKIDVYRAYLEYAGEKHFWVVGRQRVPFGVGRLWNPIDVFNPIDSLSIETDERKGTVAVRYEYAINDLSNFDCTISKHKSAVRLKGFLQYADLALAGVIDDENNRKIIGYEIEGDLLDTGIELRSEGGGIWDRARNKYSTEFIIGADYGFANSLTILGEYKHDDDAETDDLGLQLGYQPHPLLTLDLLYIVNLDDRSFVTAPSMDYSLSDEMTLKAGMFFYNGDAMDEFGAPADLYYLNWFIHF